MSGRTRLPGEGCLPGLFEEAPETDFSRPDQLGVSGLQQGRQQRIQRTVVMAAVTDSRKQRIGSPGSWSIPRIAFPFFIFE